MKVVIIMKGDRLSELRKDNSLTQEELGKILDIKRDSLSTYETDKSEASYKTIISIAKYFDISLDYLFGLTDEPVSYNPKNVIKLPDDFPEELIPIVKLYINFIKDNPLP